MIKGYCLTSDELPSDDNFVGIRFIKDKPQVVFPHGFDISDDDSERKRLVEQQYILELIKPQLFIRLWQLEHQEEVLRILHWYQMI